MVRISKQEERRKVSPRKRKKPSPKTGPLKDALKDGYKSHPNALEGEIAKKVFIGKVK